MGTRHAPKVLRRITFGTGNDARSRRSAFLRSFAASATVSWIMETSRSPLACCTDLEGVPFSVSLI